MKKRIISVFLAFAVLIGVFSAPKRARAAAAAVTIVSIGVLAWEILDIMIKGEEPAIIVGIRTLIESGVDALTNPDSYFQQTYGDFWNDFGGGYEAVYNMALEMYENGEISISNGKVNLTYEQYKQFFDLTYNLVPNIGIDFNTPNYYFVFDYSPGRVLPILSLPVNDVYFKTSNGQSYGLIFYDDSKVVFSSLYFRCNYLDSFYSGGAYYLDSKFVINSSNWWFYNSDYETLDYYNYHFSYLSLSSFRGYTYYDRDLTIESCFVFENGSLSYKPVSSVDVTGLKCGIISTIGVYGDFLKSISGVSTGESVANKLDDLSTVLPVEESPVLSIPVNPDLSVPIPDQVTVSLPGVVDAPLSDYLNPVLTDVDVPSIIWTKFPFCIPYDFVRFLELFASDPVAPVFRIPISTHPQNLEQWADNETIGDLVSPDDPMFDIDEEIVIDFAHIPLVQPICYTVFIVGFVIVLIKLTPKLIQH